jgi:hypothetical protein
MQDLLKDNPEQLDKMKSARKVQLTRSKTTAKEIEKKPESLEPPNLRSSRDERPSKGGKADSKDKATTAKGNTKHSEVNGGVTSNAKLKNNLGLKRKLSTA